MTARENQLKKKEITGGTGIPTIREERRWILSGNLKFPELAAGSGIFSGLCHAVKANSIPFLPPGRFCPCTLFLLSPLPKYHHKISPPVRNLMSIWGLVNNKFCKKFWDGFQSVEVVKYESGLSPI